MSAEGPNVMLTMSLSGKGRKLSLLSGLASWTLGFFLGEFDFLIRRLPMVLKRKSS